MVSDGHEISNRAPDPKFPVSRIVIPVIDKISRERNRPSPVFFPYWKMNIFSFSWQGIPTPSSSQKRLNVSPFLSTLNLMKVFLPNKREGLPLPALLGTGRDAFASSGSSLPLPYMGDR